LKVEKKLTARRLAKGLWPFSYSTIRTWRQRRKQERYGLHSDPRGQPNPLLPFMAEPDKQNPRVLAKLRGIQQNDPEFFSQLCKFEVAPYLVLSALDAPDLLARSRSNLKNFRKYPRNSEWLRRFDAEADRLGCPVILLLIPPGHEVDKRTWPGLQRMGYHIDPRLLHEHGLADEVRRLAEEELGWAVVDLYDTMKQSPKLAYFPIDGHWNAQGHRLAAQALLAKMQELGFVPKSPQAAPPRSREASDSAPPN